MGRTLLAGLLICVLLIGCPFLGVDPSLPSPDSRDTWAQYRLEPSHQGVAPEGTVLGGNMDLLWKSLPLNVGAYTASKSSPAVDGDQVYIGCDDGHLYALDRDTGEVVWSFRSRSYEVERKRTDTLHRGIHGSPALLDGRVFIGDYTGRLYALDSSTGALLWERRLGHSIGASPVAYGGYIFIAVEYAYPDGRVFVVTADTGLTAYRTPFLGNHPHSSVSIDTERDLMFVGANNGLFFCFDYVAGSELWRADTGGAVKSTAAVGPETVYITSWSGNLHAYSIESGSALFTAPTGDLTMSSPALFDGRVYFGSHDNRLYCVDARTGAEQWSYLTRSNIQSSPTVVAATGVVVIGSRDDRVLMLDTDSGSPVWSAVLDGDITSVPVAEGNRLYVNDDTGTVWCFEHTAAE